MTRKPKTTKAKIIKLNPVRIEKAGQEAPAPAEGQEAAPAPIGHNNDPDPETAPETAPASLTGESLDVTLKNVAQAILELDGKIAELNTKRREIRNEYIKGNDITLRDFNTLYRLWKIEDEEKRLKSVTDMKTVAGALGIQLDLFGGAGS